jgi:hypothetical protein
MENTTGPHELTPYYAEIVHSYNNKDKTDSDGDVDETDASRTSSILDTLSNAGITIKKNNHHTEDEKVEIYSYHKDPTRDTITPLTSWEKHGHINPLYKTPPDQHPINIPYRDTHQPWKTTNKNWTPGTTAHICTDGSTFPGKFSGAALTFIENSILNYEFWGPKGMYWKLSVSDNYIAEISAIDKALRTLPVDVDITIWTDSLSSIQSIDNILKSHKSPTRMSGRPYLRAIKRIIEIRTKHQASTNILHIKSHTGLRDPASLGNAEADRWARYMGVSKDVSTDCNRNLMANELPFVVYIATTTTDNEGNTSTTKTPIHGDIRRELKNRHHHALVSLWSTRNKRGEIIRDHRNETLALIKSSWKVPSSHNIRFLLDILNQADLKQGDATGGRSTVKCTNCTRNEEATTNHRLIDCPAMADIWNAADDEIWKALDLTDTLHGIRTPSSKALNTTLRDDLHRHTMNLDMTTNLITRCHIPSTLLTPMVASAKPRMHKLTALTAPATPPSPSITAITANTSG